LYLRGGLNLRTGANAKRIIAGTGAQLNILPGFTAAEGTGAVAIRRAATNAIRALFPSIESAINDATYGVASNEKIEVQSGTYTVATDAEINPCNDPPGTGAQNIQMIINPGATINVQRGVYLNSTGRIQLAHDVTLQPSIILVNADKRGLGTDPILGFFPTMARALQVSKYHQTTLVGPGVYNYQDLYTVRNESLIGTLHPERNRTTIIVKGAGAPPPGWQGIPCIDPPANPNELHGEYFGNLLLETDEYGLIFESALGRNQDEFYGFLQTKTIAPKVGVGLIIDLAQNPDYQFGSEFTINHCLFKNFDVGVDMIYQKFVAKGYPIKTAVVRNCIFDNCNIGIRALASHNLTTSSHNCFYNNSLADIQKGGTAYSGATSVNAPTLTGGQNIFVAPGYVDEVNKDYRLATNSNLIDAGTNNEDIGPYQMDGFFEFADFLNVTITFSDHSPSNPKIVQISDGNLIQPISGTPFYSDIVFEYVIGPSLRPMFRVIRKSNWINNTAEILLEIRPSMHSVIQEVRDDYIVAEAYVNSVVMQGAPILLRDVRDAAKKISVYPDNIAPPKVTAITTNVTSQGVVLTWEMSVAADVKRYKIYRSSTLPVDMNAPTTLQIASVGNNFTTFTDTGADGRAYYGIVAYDYFGNQSPVVTAMYSKPVPDIAVLPTITGECSATITVTPTATDNYAGKIVGTTNDPLTYTQQGTYVVTWKYDGGRGNDTTQTQTVVVKDVTAPVPDKAVLPTITGQCSATITVKPTATDNCAGKITGTTGDRLTYTHQGTYVVTWKYDDGHGNIASQTQTVVVKDVTKPKPDKPILPTITGQCSATITVKPTATDNCAGKITGTTGDRLTYTQQGTYVVTWKYNDGHCNVTTQTQRVIVKDVTPPRITKVTASPNVLSPLNNKMVPVKIGVVATDNCTESAALVSSIISVTCNEQNKCNDWKITGKLSLLLKAGCSVSCKIRVYTIKIQCKDKAGNTTTATTTVTVPNYHCKR
jgi:hypothetical protein